MRERNYKVGVIYGYTPGEGLKKVDFNREEYLNQLEKESLERAQEAQRKALEEKRPLPPDAIKLVK